MISYGTVRHDQVQYAYCAGMFGLGNPDAERYIADADMFICVRASDFATLGLFGAQRTSLCGSEAFIWFADTPLLALHRVGFLRSVHKVLALFFEHYATLVGVSKDPRAVAWLTWLGAEFGPGDPAPFIFRRP